MTAIQGTNVIAPIVPYSAEDEYPSHEAAYGRGGYRTVATIAARDAIPALRREAGMLVYVVDGGKIWKLAADLSSWTELSSASSWAELTGKPSVFAPASHTHVPADVGLGAVDNTADADKPVSAAQAAADASVASVAAADATSKANAAKAYATQRANHTGTQTAATISDFAAAVVAAAPPTTNASLLTSGTLDAARLPTHVHSIGDVSGLQTALDSKQPAGSYAASSHTHTAGQVSGLATVATTGSYNDLANRPTIPAAVTSLPATSITGLATVATTGSYADLSGRPTLGTAASAASSDFAASSHTHALSSLTQSGATTGQVATWSGSAWAPATPSSGGAGVTAYANTAAFPSTGSSSTIYMTTAGRLYRWVSADSVYAEIGTIGGLPDPVDGGTYA